MLHTAKNMQKLTLKILNHVFAVHRYAPEHSVPAEVLNMPFFSVTRTDEELSVAVPAHFALESDKADTGWSCLKVMGPLDFGMTGILSEISGVLAAAEISLFAISTYDTDYILIKKQNLTRAAEKLRQKGYTIIYE
jgi:hypothetical protein